MKKLLFATSALILAGPAFGADLRLPVKAPMMAAAPVPYSWTGCYIGAQVGYGWGYTDFTDPSGSNFAPGGQTVRDQTRGGLAGGQIGCNYQFAGNWVVGIEGDYTWANINGTVNDPFFGGKNGAGPSTLTSKTDALASATGRIGYAFDRTLVYVKGGAAWSHNRYDMALFALNIGFPPPVPVAGSDTRLGWTAGVGIEYALSDSWSAKLEYDHYEFGSRTVSLTGVNFFGPQTVLADVRQRFDTVKVGINYHFWSVPAAVVARY
jgi:outer membrane immunogenic protein